MALFSTPMNLRCRGPMTRCRDDRGDAGAGHAFRQRSRSDASVSRRPRAGGVSAWDASGAPKMFWQAPGVYSTAVGYAGGYTPNPTYQEVCSGMTGHTEVVLVVFDPNVRPASMIDLEDLLGESRSDAGDAAGERRRHPVSVGDLHLLGRAETGCRGVARGLSGSADRGGLRSDHDRDCRRAAVLLRRGLSPAVLGEESRDGYCGHGGTGVSCPVGLTA